MEAATPGATHASAAGRIRLSPTSKRVVSAARPVWPRGHVLSPPGAYISVQLCYLMV